MRVDAAGLPITLDVEGWDVVVVGDDAHAAKKRALLAAAGARVRDVAPGAFADDAVDGARLPPPYLDQLDWVTTGICRARSRSRSRLPMCSDSGLCTHL